MKGRIWNAETAETEIIPLDCISELYGYLNQKGYASVFCGGLGTKGSEGFTLTGSREEILAFKSVIDWLNGRARAFTNKTDNIEIKATWCTGNVAMSAKSYLGTMCIGVAATGVEGLKTKKITLYKNLEVSNKNIFKEILKTSQELKKNELVSKKIVCKGNEIYVHVDNVQVALGTTVTAEKIAQIKPIVQKLDGKEGTLHLENYTIGNETITFTTEKFQEEN